MIRKLMRDFAEGEVAPGADERDRTKTFPKEIMKKMSELDLMGLPFPEKYGGGGADTISFAIAVEELSRVCASTGITYSAHISLGCAPLLSLWNRGTEREVSCPIMPRRKFGGLWTYGT